MNITPIGYRLHISIFGRRNVGKSTLINAITNQKISIVSDKPGTTTDPVLKTMEILPIGPVAIIDTAGLDDSDSLGTLRKEKTYDIMKKTDFAIVVLSADEGMTEFEKNLVKDLETRKISTIAVINKCDLHNVSQDMLNEYREELGIPVTKVSAITKDGIEELKVFISQNVDAYDKCQLNIVKDLIKPQDLIVLVTHIDCSAPKGRIILPQQQMIRDIIEANATAVVTQEKALGDTLTKLKEKPSLIITDSLVSDIVEDIIPEDYKLTSFSILIARQKGNLEVFLHGLENIKTLKDGSRLLIVETCTHHRQPNDLGRAQIPNYIKELTQKELEFDWASGTYFPKDISRYDGIIHCGGCMVNRQEMQSRIKDSIQYNVPITNYGILITHAQGILERVLEPFPLISDRFKSA